MGLIVSPPRADKSRSREANILDGWVAKEIIFTSRARAYNDFRGY